MCCWTVTLSDKHWVLETQAHNGIALARKGRERDPDLVPDSWSGQGKAMVGPRPGKGRRFGRGSERGKPLLPTEGCGSGFMWDEPSHFH
jgi:hypothetical protein